MTAEGKVLVNATTLTVFMIKMNAVDEDFKLSNSLGKVHRI